ncbi:MAG: copper transporter [Dermatophilaceae bacterium]|nr:copper transporter [Intrasporangiaceae bacterium]
MIDFRFHLVSIASVFLALAVGIVLGAGPLKGTLGDTLANEVSQLRSDADSLRSDLATAQAGEAARDDVITALRPRSIDGLLTGSSVSLLALPGSPDTAVEIARESLTESGATIGAEVRLGASWTSDDPPEVTDRTAAAAELRELLAGDLPVGIAPERVIALALGWALAIDPTAGEEGSDGSASAADQSTETPTTPTDSADDLTDDPGQAGEEAIGGEEGTQDGAGARILEILADNGLLTVEGEEAPARTDGVVVVTPVTADDSEVTMTEWTDLIAGIEEAGAVVLAGESSGDADPETHLIEAVRNSAELSVRVSTVDHLTSPVGRVALPFVVVEQLAGRSGHYGVLDSAAQLFPPLPENAAP